ncbi:hypothetical protein BIBE0010001c01_00007 [Bifidobacterium phage BigBern1]|nr:hypothetical protein BIBE0010001c01_00007 [Bifidobacterium phage BigBern1]
MTATLQDEARWEAQYQTWETKRSVDDAVSRLQAAIGHFETAGQTEQAKAYLPVISGLTAQSVALDGLCKRLDGEEQA